MKHTVSMRGKIISALNPTKMNRTSFGFCAIIPTDGSRHSYTNQLLDVCNAWGRFGAFQSIFGHIHPSQSNRSSHALFSCVRCRQQTWSSTNKSNHDWIDGVGFMCMCDYFDSGGVALHIHRTSHPNICGQ